MTGIVQRSINILHSRKDVTLAADSFENKRSEFQAKATALRANISSLKEEIKFLRSKSNEWESLISETEWMIMDKNTGWNRSNRSGSYDKKQNLSDEAVQALKNLLRQAKGHQELDDRDIQTKQALITQASTNLQHITSVLSRLEMLNYQRSIDKSLQERYDKQKNSEAVMIEKLDSKEFEREIRRLSYSTQALLELTGSTHNDELEEI